MLPDSIFEKSRMSLMTESSDSPLAWIVPTQSRWLSVSSVSVSRLVMPMTPFIGVRISWLMMARNSLFARSAASAASFASRSSSFRLRSSLSCQRSISICNVTKWIIEIRPANLPVSDVTITSSSPRSGTRRSSWSWASKKSSVGVKIAVCSSGMISGIWTSARCAATGPKTIRGTSAFSSTFSA